MSTPWRSRIVGHGEEPPDQLLANPANWRIHPKEQQRALAGSLSEVGWVAQVMVNRRTGHVVDGHLRVEATRRLPRQRAPGADRSGRRSNPDPGPLRPGRPREGRLAQGHRRGARGEEKK